MLVFENCVIKKYWPADDKGEDDEIIRQMVIQADVTIENSSQVGELYNNMVRGLVRVLFLDELTGEEYLLPAAGIRPFNIKQKRSKVGKGPDAESVKSEFAALTIVSRIPDDSGGILADLFPFFNIQVKMTLEPIKPFETVRQESSEESETP